MRPKTYAPQTYDDLMREREARRVLAPQPPPKRVGKLRPVFWCNNCWGYVGHTSRYCPLERLRVSPTKRRVPVGKRRDKRRPSKP